MYWRLWRLYQLLLQFMNSFLFGSTVVVFFSIPVCRNILLWVVWIFLGEDMWRSRSAASFVRAETTSAAKCSLKDPWSVAHKHNTRVCVSNLQKSQFELALVVYNYYILLPKKLGEIHRNRLLVDGAVTTWKKSNPSSRWGNACHNIGDPWQRRWLVGLMSV